MVIHVDQRRRPSEAPAALASALAPVRVVRAAAGRPRRGRARSTGRQAVRTMLTVGRTARGAGHRDAQRRPRQHDRRSGSAASREPGAQGRRAGSCCRIYQRYRYDGTLTQALVVPLMRSLFGQQLRASAGRGVRLLGGGRRRLPRAGRSGRRTSAGTGSSSGCPRAAIEQGLHGRPGRARPATVAATAARPPPLGPTVGRVAGALFSLAERLESLLARRARLGAGGASSACRPSRSTGGAAVDPERMQVGFLQGVRDLLPIWERILAPETPRARCSC